MKYSEKDACRGVKVNINDFNDNVKLPYGLTAKNIYKAMNDFINFLTFINSNLAAKKMTRLESMIMPANFSSIVGEFVHSTIPKYCKTLARNQFHNGHPDLIPKDKFPNNAIQYSHEGIEVKASRYLKGWQGHNPEKGWLMVFCFDANRPIDKFQNILSKPFKFIYVAAGNLEKKDWNYSGRSAGSRRTITASINNSGYEKISANWVYKPSK